MTRPVEIHIDRLELVGVPAARRHAVAAAFARELERRLTASPLDDPTRLADLRSVSGPALGVALDGPPAQVGTALAAALHATLRDGGPR